MDKIIITSADVAEANDPAEDMRVKRKFIPLWWRLLTSLLILIPPLLFIVTIIGLLTCRRKQLSVRHAYTSLYCWFLLASGIIWMVIGLFLLLRQPAMIDKSDIYNSAISFSVQPNVPSNNTLTGKEIVQELSSVVVVVHRSGLYGSEPFNEMCGAGVIVFATHNGCLVLTSRHVVDAVSHYHESTQVVAISLQDGQRAMSKILGVHRTFDLALLWLNRKKGPIEFIQPVRDYSSIEVGEPIYVIGHPQGLEFSISSGLVAQKRKDELIQISAPVSPGNSGGPVYDSNGRLVGIVQSMFDKTINPNAENLNFAVRADVLLDVKNWALAEGGELVISTLMMKMTGIRNNLDKMTPNE
jgi:S1-C subfamily serine protease